MMPTTLNADEIKGLYDALDDEYRAFATYDRVIQDFGPARPFINIRDAEARHIQALLSIFARYGLQVPANPWIGKTPHYPSLEEACRASVEAEIDNASLYERILASTERPDIIQVYLALQEASQERHLPAFQRHASPGANDGHQASQHSHLGQGATKEQQRCANRGQRHGQRTGFWQRARQKSLPVKNTSRHPCKPISQKNTMAASRSLAPKRMCFRAVFVCMLLVLAQPAFAGSGTVYLIHTGDIHGHLVPRSNVRSDGTGRMEGGLARMYTIIQQIRAKARHETKSMALLINTGDTLQGSGEALFTRGQAMIDVLNLFRFDAHAPGNWDFLYGTKRFEEVFKGDGTTPPLAPWNALASNLYDADRFDDTALCAPTGLDPNGKTRKLKRVLPPYAIKQVGDVKVGILGFTTARAITAIGPNATAGYRFSEGDRELPCYVRHLRQHEHVDLLVMISELEMARVLKLVEANAGIDVVLSADMHEETIRPIVVRHPGAGDTIVVEEGQDGTMIGEIRLQVSDKKVTAWQWTPHVIADDIPEDPKVAARIGEVRKPFVKETFVPGQTVTIAGNTTTLLRPLDEVIAQSEVDLHRSNFLDEDLPAVVEGSSHNLIADAMRWAAGTDVAAIRGFRYGTHIRAGQAITMEDIYHFVPIAAKLGRASNVCGADLKKQLENVTAGVFHPDPARWQGGWVFGYSGATFDLDACGGFGLSGMPLARISNLKLNGAAVNTSDAYDPARKRCKSGAKGYQIAGYWYADDPATINNCATCRGRPIQMVTKDQKVVDLATGAPLPDSSSLLDVTEAVVKYLREGLGGKVTADNLLLHRITILRLPTINPYPFKVIQTLEGATAKTCPLARPTDDQEQF